MRIKQVRLIAPAIFWLFQIIVHIIRNIHVIAEKSFTAILNPIFVTYPLDIVTFYLFYFFFAPRFYRKSNLQFYISLSIFYLIAYGNIWALVYSLLGVENIKIGYYYFSSFGHTMLYAFYGIIFRLAIDWFENRETRKELEKQNIKTELALLRSQINPHFLFNTLNNINSFATKKSDKTSFAIIKLSEIMRYMLYEARENKVFIEKEILHIENYLALQKLRYKTSDFIKFESSCEVSNILIPPMLFIPFIENSFKHGKKGFENDIIIKLKVLKDSINFECTNGVRKLNDTEKNKIGGIGMENIKRRLELLYSENHNLSIKEENNLYIVKLRIELNENKLYSH